MKLFEDLLALLQPKEEYDQLKGKCRELWNSFSPEMQDSVFSRIEEKKKRKEFVDYNPLFAIRKNMPKKQGPQTLSFNDYYARYGTTEPQNGWKRVFIADERKTIYVKQG